MHKVKPHKVRATSIASFKKSSIYILLADKGIDHLLYDYYWRSSVN